MPGDFPFDDDPLAQAAKALLEEVRAAGPQVPAVVRALYNSVRPGAEGLTVIVTRDAPEALLDQLREHGLSALGEEPRVERGAFKSLDTPKSSAFDTPLPADLLVEAGSQVGGIVGTGPTLRGTLGWSFVGTDGNHYMLSNWHVLCSEVVAPKTMPRIQLTGDDGTMPIIGEVVKFAPMNVKETLWDLAIARYVGVQGVGRYPRRITAQYPLDVESSPNERDAYFKVGFMSKLTRAEFLGVCFRIDGYRSLRVQLVKQLLFAPPAGASGSARVVVKPGDSGSVVVNERTHKVSGLVHHRLVMDNGEVRAVASPLGRLGLRKTGEVTVDGAQLPVIEFPTKLQFEK